MLRFPIDAEDAGGFSTSVGEIRRHDQKTLKPCLIRRSRPIRSGERAPHGKPFDADISTCVATKEPSGLYQQVSRNTLQALCLCRCVCRCSLRAEFDSGTAGALAPIDPLFVGTTVVASFSRQDRGHCARCDGPGPCFPAGPSHGRLRIIVGAEIVLRSPEVDALFIPCLTITALMSSTATRRRRIHPPSWSHALRGAHLAIGFQCLPEAQFTSRLPIAVQRLGTQEGSFTRGPLRRRDQVL